MLAGRPAPRILDRFCPSGSTCAVRGAGRPVRPVAIIITIINMYMYMRQRSPHDAHHMCTTSTLMPFTSYMTCTCCRSTIHSSPQYHGHDLYSHASHFPHDLSCCRSMQHSVHTSLHAHRQTPRVSRVCAAQRDLFRVRRQLRCIPATDLGFAPPREIYLGCAARVEMHTGYRL